MKQKLIQHLERLFKELENFYPDDDSKRYGYRDAIGEILEYVREMDE